VSAIRLVTNTEVGALDPWSYGTDAPAAWLALSGEAMEIAPGPAGDRGWIAAIREADPGPSAPLRRAAAIARRLGAATPRNVSGPRFRGGLVAVLSYDLGRTLERVPTLLPVGSTPDLVLALCDDVTAEGAHERRFVTRPGAAPIEAEPRSLASIPLSRAVAPLRPEVDEAGHRAAVVAVRDAIASGAVYQVNTTFRLRGTLRPGEARAAFSTLRAQNPAPFLALLESPWGTLVSASPELFLRVDGRDIVSRPMKGTRPRGIGLADEAARASLAASQKDRAELTMIVDLVRNDLGRVCASGSIDRSARITIEGHPSVWQAVGTVEGRLAPGRDAWDAVAASFPPGSCIGAPKIRAMALIEQLEASRRGVYTGAFGWFDFGGDACLAVTIRSLWCAAGQVEAGVGGGIVWDSEPAAEWAEALLKAQALLRAMT
jgi:para-aminobenzoate synthetase component 1